MVILKKECIVFKVKERKTRNDSLSSFSKRLKTKMKQQSIKARELRGLKTSHYFSQYI